MDERILSIIAEVNEDIITYKGENMFDDGILDSFEAVEIIAALEEGLDITIDAECVVEENLKTKDAIVAMVKRILEHE